MKVLVIYDIVSDKVRRRIINVCKDYGLERIQFSCFMGDLSRTYIDELSVKLHKTLGKHEGRVHMFPFAENIVERMLVIDNMEDFTYYD